MFWYGQRSQFESIATLLIWFQGLNFQKKFQITFIEFNIVKIPQLQFEILYKTSEKLNQ